MFIYYYVQITVAEALEDNDKPENFKAFKDLLIFKSIFG